MLRCLAIFGRPSDSEAIRIDSEGQRVCVFANTVMEGWVSFWIGRIVVANELRVGFLKLIDEFFVAQRLFSMVFPSLMRGDLKERSIGLSWIQLL